MRRRGPGAARGRLFLVEYIDCEGRRARTMIEGEASAQGARRAFLAHMNEIGESYSDIDVTEEP